MMNTPFVDTCIVIAKCESVVRAVYSTPPSTELSSFESSSINSRTIIASELFTTSGARPQVQFELEVKNYYYELPSLPPLTSLCSHSQIDDLVIIVNSTDSDPLPFCTCKAQGIDEFRDPFVLKVIFVRSQL